MYDPVLGRFLGVDPIIPDAGNSQSINGYGYCINNPLKFTDPSGYLFNPGFNPRLWHLIVTFWYSTPDDQDRIFERNGFGGWYGRRASGHFEKILIKQNGGFHGSGINSESKPFEIDEVTVAEQWIWDFPKNGDLSDWFRSLPDLDKNTTTTLNSMSLVLGSVTTLAYISGSPMVGAFVSSVLIYPSMGISLVSTMDVWGDYFRNANPTQSDLNHAYVNTAVTIFGTFYWPFAIPAGVYGILDINGKFNWNK
jgi:hypothetical protein